MRANIGRVSILALLLAGLALPVWAKRLSTSITFNQPEKVAGKTLKSGDYQAIFNTDTHKLELRQAGNVVATPPAVWQPTKYKVMSGAVVDHGKLEAVQFSGQKGFVKIK